MQLASSNSSFWVNEDEVSAVQLAGYPIARISQLLHDLLLFSGIPTSELKRADEYGFISPLLVFTPLWVGVTPLVDIFDQRVKEVEPVKNITPLSILTYPKVLSKRQIEDRLNPPLNREKIHHPPAIRILLSESFLHFLEVNAIPLFKSSLVAERIHQEGKYYSLIDLSANNSNEFQVLLKLIRTIGLRKDSLIYDSEQEPFVKHLQIVNQRLDRDSPFGDAGRILEHRYGYWDALQRIS